MENKPKSPRTHFLFAIIVAVFAKEILRILLGNNPITDVIVGIIWSIFWIIATSYAVISPATFEAFYGNRLKFQPTMLVLFTCLVMLIYYFAVTVPLLSVNN